MNHIVDLSEANARSYRWHIVAAWTIVAAIYGLILYAQVGLPPWFALLNGALYYYVLAGLMVPVTRWARSEAARQLSTRRQIVLHIAIGVGVIIGWQAIEVLLLWLLMGPDFWQAIFADSWMFQLLTAVMNYGAVLGLTLTLQAHKRERERESREAEIAIVARDAQLAALKAQLQPHFVLNVLNSLLVLIEKDPPQAREMVFRLADLMRAVFARADVVQIPLSQEVDFIKAYLDIERMRFGARLSTTFTVDAAAADVVLPAFLLQPIVENALKHGIAPYAAGGEVRVGASIRGGRLQLVVQNSSVSHTSTQVTRPGPYGRGLDLTERRLHAAYGDGYQLRFDRDPHGLTVLLDLPMVADAA